MLITPRPGTHRESLLQSLRDVHTKATNLQGGGAARTAYGRLLEYLDWANEAVQVLANQISSSDLDRLVLTKRHELLLSGVGTFAGTDAQRIVNGLIALEVRQRADSFEVAIQTLKQHIDRWSRSDYFVVADSSFYIHHPEKLELVDLAEVLNFHDGPIHLLVPMVVVDELDRLKEIKDKLARWRSSYTLAVLDRLFQDGADAARLRDADPEVQRAKGTRRGEVNVEILFDPPGHVRLPIADDEIVDRAAAIVPLVGRPVTLLTYDTGQASRGRRAGLKVIKPSRPIGDEPEQEAAKAAVPASSPASSSSQTRLDR